MNPPNMKKQVLTHPIPDLDDAARHRTNTEKDLDSMFFSGTAPRRQRPPTKPQDPPPNEPPKSTQQTKVTTTQVTASDKSEKTHSKVEKELTRKVSEKS